MTFDLDNLGENLSNTGFVVQVTDPKTGDLMEGVTLTILGPQSDKARKIEAARQNALVKRAKATRSFDLDADDQERHTINKMAELTVAWTGFGDKVCNVENVKLLYSNTHPKAQAVYAQVLAAFNYEANFFR